MTFAMQYEGQIVHYPMHATFVIEQKPIRGKDEFRILSSKTDISSAITKFSRSRKPGMRTRMLAAASGQFTKILSRRG